LDLSLSHSGDHSSGIPNGRGAQKHPYARTPSMLIDSPPRQASRSRQAMPLCPRHEVVSPPCRHTSSFQSQETRPHRSIKAEFGLIAPRKTSGTRKVDLTPGMESGMRPPKSGLSMTVSDYAILMCLALSLSLS
jgi:hypothetical protein